MPPCPAPAAQAKWTSAALLSGVDLIKLGYITRAGPKDNRNHLVLGTQVGGAGRGAAGRGPQRGGRSRALAFCDLVVCACAQCSASLGGQGGASCRRGGNRGRGKSGEGSLPSVSILPAPKTCPHLQLKHNTSPFALCRTPPPRPAPAAPQAVKPRDFAMQMNLNMDNCWGIVRALLDLCVEKLEADGAPRLVLRLGVESCYPRGAAGALSLEPSLPSFLYFFTCTLPVRAGAG